MNKCCYDIIEKKQSTGEFTKSVREMLSQLFVMLYMLSIFPSAHKQLRQHLPNTFCEFPCMWVSVKKVDGGYLVLICNTRVFTSLSIKNDITFSKFPLYLKN